MEMAEIFDKLQAVADRYDELNELISDPEVNYYVRVMILT